MYIACKSLSDQPLKPNPNPNSNPKSIPNSTPNNKSHPKAVIYSHHGPPNVLQVAMVKRPTPKPYQV